MYALIRGLLNMYGKKIGNFYYFGTVYFKESPRKTLLLVNVGIIHFN
jgi:hypothetical protein